MDFALTYLPRRAVERLWDFFHHWYIDGSRYLLHSFFSLLESLDQTFAVRVTLEHFFEPLYKDYSIVGRILGPIFRSVRVTIGSVVYLFLAAIFFCTYLVWLAIPIVLILGMLGAIHLTPIQVP